MTGWLALGDSCSTKAAEPVLAGGVPKGAEAASYPGGGIFAPGRYGATAGRTKRSKSAGEKYKQTTRAIPRTVRTRMDRLDQLRVPGLPQNFFRRRREGVGARQGEAASALPYASSMAHCGMRPLGERRTFGGA